MHSAWDSAKYAEDGAIKVCTWHCTRSRICTVQGTMQENEYGGVSSFARGKILACTFPAQGWDALLGRRHCSTLWNTLDNSLLLGLAYQTMLLFRLACWISKVATSKLDSRLHHARGCEALLEGQCSGCTTTISNTLDSVLLILGLADYQIMPLMSQLAFWTYTKCD